MMGYLPGTAQVEGSVRFEGMDITAMSDAELREMRGNHMAMVYQDPVTSLNPSMRVGRQVEEALVYHLRHDSGSGARIAQWICSRASVWQTPEESADATRTS